MTINALNYNASAYAGNMHPVNGLTQLKLLKQEGMLPDHSLLEIGCGALMGAIPMMSYLDAEHSVIFFPSYCYPEKLKLPYRKRLLAICKTNREEVRS